MDFFTEQARAQRRSRWLLVAFLLGVIATVLALDVVFLIGVELLDDRTESAGVVELIANHPRAFWTIAVLLVLYILGKSFEKAIELGEGGRAIARSLGATLVPRDIQAADRRRLRNVIEEVAVAAGLPVPEVYVLDQEIGINAFAAGWSPADAAIVVTQGALEHLDRDELQGVVAHEFSHVLNGDMRLNIKLVAMLAGLLSIAIGARKVLAESPNVRGEGAFVALLVAFLAWMVGSIGLLVGQLIKATVSRQREYLADAEAVRMTRQSRGIAGALHKIEAWPAGSTIMVPESESVSHMLFGSSGSPAFATHPPLEDRIARVAGRVDRSLVARHRERFKEILQRRIAERDARLAEVRAVRRALDALLPAAASLLPLEPDALVASVGRPGAASFELSEAVANAVPPRLESLARGEDAALLLLALPLDDDAAVREHQLSGVSTKLGATVAAKVREIHAESRSLHPLQTTALGSVAIDGLRHLPAAELAELLEAFRAIAEADARLSLREYCLARLAQRFAQAQLSPKTVDREGRLSLSSCGAEARLLLSVLARFGHPDALEAQRAYRAGTDHLGTRVALELAVPRDWPTALDRAFTVLQKVRPTDKPRLVQSMARVMLHDRRITVEEAELLRAACAMLRCPLPLVLTG